MKLLYKTLGKALGLVLLTTTLNNNAVAQQGETYACQVQAEGGRQGLVMLQTTSKEEAVRKAPNFRALTIDGSWHDSIALVECVLRPDGKFRDSGFQRFYENVPL